jgi:hypothetical protein
LDYFLPFASASLWYVALPVNPEVINGYLFINSITLLTVGAIAFYPHDILLFPLNNAGELLSYCRFSELIGKRVIQ